MTAETRRTSSPIGLRFSARDLVSTALFAVLFIVVTFVIGLLGIVSPLVWLLLVPLQAVAGGVVAMLFMTRITHPGMLTLFAVVVALFFLIQGNTLLSTVAIVLLGVGAELVLRAGGYRSRWAAIGAYTVFSLAFFTPFLPFILDREAYLASDAWAAMGDAYTSAANSLVSVPALLLLLLGIAVGGFLGGLLGSALLRKHFVRAGLA